MNKKLLEYKALNIDAKVWHLTSGKTNDELKAYARFNSDLGDVLRK